MIIIILAIMLIELILQIVLLPINLTLTALIILKVKYDEYKLRNAAKKGCYDE